MIELRAYWMGRDVKFKRELTPDIRQNATETLRRVNTLLEAMAGDGVVPEANATGSLVNSGWRPAAVNAGVPGAAVRSKHMTGQAVDLFDPEGELDDWCMDHLGALEAVGLWLEHPSATKGWCHLQTVPPKSQRRVFYP